MADRVRAIKGKRTYLKGQITSLETFLTVNKDDLDLTNLKLRFEKLKSNFESFEDLQQELLLLEEQADHEDEYEAITNNYFDLASRVEKLLRTDVDIASVHSSGEGSGSTEKPPVFGRPKLPEIPLPSFSGNYEEWITFKDDFESLIHEDHFLTTAAKMSYLKRALSGEARDKISLFTKRSADYEKAWDYLCDCYDNKRIIISKHLSNLTKLPQVEKDKMPEGLTKLADHTRTHMKALERYNIHVTPEVVVNLLEDRLPPFLATKWDETITSNDEFPKLDDLISFIRRWAARLTLRPPNNKSKGDNQYAKRKSKGNESGPQGNKQARLDPKPQTFVTAAQQKPEVKKRELKCFGCQKAHAITECKEFLELTRQKRFGKAKELGLCINCLKGPHKAKDCRADRCLKCSKAHNTLLHFENEVQDP